MHFDAGSLPVPDRRPRRLRATPALRRMFRETALGVEHFIHPLFVHAGRGVERPISSMPGHAQHPVGSLGH
jgi:porphobilinogen synthase